jgi:hypothetical protein
MRVLITGGAGFIGSHLADAYLFRGDRVHVIDDLSTGSIRNIEFLKSNPSFSYTIDRIQNALTVYNHEMIGRLVIALRDQISSTQKLPKLDQAIPLVLSGGTSMPKGFLDFFTSTLRSGEFPVRISEIRLSADPLHSTARGALMAALC